MSLLPLPFPVNRTPARPRRRGCGRRCYLLERYLVVGIEEFHAIPGPLVNVVLQERKAPVGEVQAYIFVPVLTGNKKRKTEIYGNTYGVCYDEKRRGEGVRDGMKGRAEAGLRGQPLGG